MSNPIATDQCERICNILQEIDGRLWGEVLMQVMLQCYDPDEVVLTLARIINTIENENERKLYA